MRRLSPVYYAVIATAALFLIGCTSKTTVNSSTTPTPSPQSQTGSNFAAIIQSYDISAIKNPNLTLKKRSTVITPRFEPAKFNNQNPTIVTLKFTEGSGIRLRNNTLVSLTNQNLDDLKPFLNDTTISAIQREFTRSEADLDAERAAALKNNPNLADLNLYYLVALPKGVPVEYVAHLLDYLNALDLVETAYIQPEASLP